MVTPDAARPEIPRFVGDPVDTLTGAVFDAKIEFRLTGPLELWWWRHYDSSQAHRRFALGAGHAHEFDRRLRFDVDGIRYEYPVGGAAVFPPLTADGAVAHNQGYAIRRVSARIYHVFRHGQPAMEFEFHHPAVPAPLMRLFDGTAEVTLEYNEARLLRRVVDSAGRILTIEHDDAGRLSIIAMNAGAQRQAILLLRNEYDERGDLVGVTHASGAGYTFAYDDAHRMIRRTGRKGFTFRFTYDRQGRCIKATGDDRLYEANLEYVVPGRVTQVTRADGGVWTYLFDEAGALTQIHDPLGGIQQFVRDESGRLRSKVDPAGNVTRVTYDAAGSPVAEITPLGYRIPLPKDPTGVDPLGHRVAGNAAEYEFGRLIDVDKIVPPDAAQAARLDLPEWTRRAIVVEAGADAPAAKPQKFTVRPIGVRWWPAPERGRFFSDFGKLVGQGDDAGRQRRWSYDASGNIASFTDFDGGTWNYQYGAWHLLMALGNPLGAESRFSFTTEGKLASCTDAAGTRTEYGFDLKDQLVEVRRHGTVRERYTRDAAGNLLAKHAGDGRILVSLEFGPGNLPTTRILASGDEHRFQYTPSGRYKSAATKKDAVEFDYDVLGNRRLDKRNGMGVEHRFERRFAVSESVIFDRFRIGYRRDGDGTLVIEDPGGRSHQIRRRLHGVVERRFSNGTEEFAQYDNRGRCLSKNARRQKQPIWTRRFEWSGEGELRRVWDGVIGEIRHQYDAAHRLRRRVLPGERIEEYEFDAADNLLRQPGFDHVSMRDGNRLAAVGGFAVEYDDRNHVAAVESPGGRTCYRYDSRDQLIAVDMPHGSWTAEYDALGRRTRKTWAGQTTEYYWNTDQLLAEVGGNGQMRLYLYADPLALTPLLFIDYDSIQAPVESGRRYIVLTDQTGTPCLVEADDGSDAWVAQVEPFGRVHLRPGARIDFNLRFPGHYFDPELGLHYNRFRYYHPAWGRYLQSDPWGTAGGLNLYAYPANPLLAVDVRGLGDENDETCPQPHETADDGEGAWAHMLQNLPDEDGADTRPPIPWGEVGESRAAFIAARDAKEGLPGPKTVAVAGDGRYASGQSPTPGFDHVDPATVKGTLDPGSPPHDSGMFPPAQLTPTDNGGTQPAFKDQGNPGSYNACHGEMQAAAAQPGQGIGVSQDMCPNCRAAAPQIAKNTGQPVVITDPEGTHVFHPDGSQHGPDDHPDLGPIPPE